MTTILFSSRRAGGVAQSSSLRIAGVLRAARVAVAFASMGACAHGGVLTQGEVGRSGARTFSAPTEHVFYACLGILKADGYEIATVDPEHGTIVTKPMAVDSTEGVTARGYRVTVSADGHGSRVVAQPMLYAGNRDISAQEVWNVSAERDQWAELFSDVDSVIAAPVQIVPELANQQVVATKPRADDERALAKTSTGQPAGGFTPATLDPNGARGSRTPAPATTTRKSTPSP